MSRLVSFAEFDHMYRLQKRSIRALAFLTTTRENKIRRTLQGHWERTITDPAEIRIRDNLDYLLGACAMMEIMAHLRAAEDWPKDAAWMSGIILSHPLVRQYYEETYPLVLPQLLRARLTGELPAAYMESNRPEAAADEQALTALVELDRRRMHDEPLEIFLSVLDGYDYRGWFIDEVISRLDDEDAVERELARDAKKKPGAAPSRLMTIMFGLDSFLRYAEDLLSLLEQHEGELISSLAWLHHSYFYGASAESVQLTLGSVRRLLRTFAREEDSRLVAAERAEHVDRILGSLADRQRWFQPAIRSGLAPFLDSLDPLEERIYL